MGTFTCRHHHHECQFPQHQYLLRLTGLLKHTTIPKFSVIPSLGPGFKFCHKTSSISGVGQSITLTPKLNWYIFSISSKKVKGKHAQHFCQDASFTFNNFIDVFKKKKSFTLSQTTNRCDALMRWSALLTFDYITTSNFKCKWFVAVSGRIKFSSICKSC